MSMWSTEACRVSIERTHLLDAGQGQLVVFEFGRVRANLVYFLHLVLPELTQLLLLGCGLGV